MAKAVFYFNSKGENTMNPDFKENEFDTTIDALLEFIECLPQETIKAINPSRYYTLMSIASQLTELLRKTIPDSELNIEIDPKFNIGSISVELDMLSVNEPEFFANIVHKADNFEIYPLTNGNIRFDITIQRVLKTLA